MKKILLLGMLLLCATIVSAGLTNVTVGNVSVLVNANASINLTNLENYTFSTTDDTKIAGINVSFDRPRQYDYNNSWRVLKIDNQRIVNYAFRSNPNTSTPKYYSFDSFRFKSKVIRYSPNTVHQIYLKKPQKYYEQFKNNSINYQARLLNSFVLLKQYHNISSSVGNYDNGGYYGISRR